MEKLVSEQGQKAGIVLANIAVTGHAVVTGIVLSSAAGLFIKEA